MLQTDFFLAIYVFFFYNLWDQKLQETTESQKALSFSVPARTYWEFASRTGEKDA